MALADRKKKVKKTRTTSARKKKKTGTSSSSSTDSTIATSNNIGRISLVENNNINIIIATCIESLIASWLSGVTFFASLLWLLLHISKLVFTVIFPCCFKERSKKIYAQSILITGASAGIGKGLALAYAKRGARLVLIARRIKELEIVKKECITAGSRRVTILSADVRDQAKMEKLLKQADAEEPFDLIIANAGVLSNTDGITGSERVLDINVRGSLNTVYPLLRQLAKRKYGQILFMSSLGAFAPVNNAFMMPYLASKASINQFAMGLRRVMKPYNVGVSVACLGMIESDLTVKELQGQYNAQLLGFQKNGPSCELVVSAVEENTALITFPLWLYILTRCVGALPYSIINLLGDEMSKGDPFSKIDKIHPIFPALDEE